ncbi:hypothetical protein AMTR_s00010p00198610 [Amborella trichopoda]|uniref:Uncharacterized protein n=1 Tax=Amborella trichopoda TaxID=13333 RepID=W1NGD7_AMBTC|nr:hypothetical protein AMTR_s00010p00198610 [Amborella trichopoda]
MTLFWKRELGPGTSEPLSIGMPPPLESGNSELESNGSVNIDSDEGSSRNGISFKSHFEEDGSQENDEKLLENDIDLPENGDNLPGNNSQENGVAHVVNVKSHLTIASNEQLPWFYAAISHLGV